MGWVWYDCWLHGKKWVNGNYIPGSLMTQSKPAISH